MNTVKSSVLAAFACACATMALTPSANAQNRELGSGGQLLDGVAAVVDNGVVLKSELQERLDVVLKNLTEQQAQQPPDQRRALPPVSVIQKQVLDQLVLREIQLQRANKVGITISDDTLNQALARVAQNLGYTLEELPAVLASENVDYAEYREDSRHDLMIEQLQQRDVVNKISITPRELDHCVEQHDANAADAFDFNVSHILITVPANATPADIEAARKKIDAIHTQLENGADFAQLAIANSQAQTALEGGSLGWRKGAQLPTVFADVVQKMQPGEFSDPIQSNSGFQIVKLNEMRGAERKIVDQLHVRHILLKPNQLLDDAAVRQKLLGIKQQLDRGDDFAAIAKSVSEDPQSATEGGDLGWLSPGDTVPEFEQRLAEMPLNKISDPIKTRYGWHLVEVLGRRQHDTTDEAKREDCVREIRAGKAEEERELWLRRLRDQAFVDLRE